MTARELFQMIEAAGKMDCELYTTYQPLSKRITGVKLGHAGYQPDTLILEFSTDPVPPVEEGEKT